MKNITRFFNLNFKFFSSLFLVFLSAWWYYSGWQQKNFFILMTWAIWVMRNSRENFFDLITFWWILWISEIFFSIKRKNVFIALHYPPHVCDPIYNVLHQQHIKIIIYQKSIFLVKALFKKMLVKWTHS